VACFPVSPLTYITDVINVSGHRMSTAEIESALILHPGVAETAVIGSADEITGQAVFAFVTLKPCVLSTLMVPPSDC
jgi:acyl-coenzyme A synthetase/AMP-(fatty) acid ligase